MAVIRDNHRLVIVTGKGGVGKSLLAAAVARCSAAAGLRTVLVTMDLRDDRHPLLDVPVGYAPRATDHGFSVARVDAYQAAAEYAGRTLPFGLMYERFFKSRTFREFAAAAPGFEELMCLGKLYNLAVETEFQRVVFDAPATGHFRDLMAVPRVTQQAVRVGPLNHNARKIEDLLLDPDRTQVLVATLAEEMPVREARELVDLCRDELRMGVGPVLLNRVVSRRVQVAEMARLSGLVDAGPAGPSVADALAETVREDQEAASQQEALAPLAASGLRHVAVPRIVQAEYDGHALVRSVAEHLLGASIFEAPPASSRSGADEATGDNAGARRAHSPPPVAAPSDTLDLLRLAGAARVIVCCGSGGVGKTTSAAALGLLAAGTGLKVQVMTIDPARRLAQAMGLEALGHEPQRVPLEAPGELWAMMLDSKRAFDHLVEAYAPNDRVRDSIFSNHYYQQLSNSLGGSRELMAMERVLETTQDNDYDLLIVDTPPSQHALDFLDAPERIVNLLDGSLTGLLVRPYGLAARAQFNFFRQSSSAALKFMERFTGVQMLADLSEFLLAFSSMFDGFKERSHRVQALLRQPTTAFLLVCAPEPASLQQVRQFQARLQQDALRVAGVLANRVHPPPAGWQRHAHGLEFSADERGGIDPLGEVGAPPLADRLARVWEDAAALHQADTRALEALLTPDMPIHAVPHLVRDLHSMADLREFAEQLARKR